MGGPVKHFLRALQYVRPYTTLAVASVTLLLLSVGVSLLLPWPLKFIIVNVLNDQPLPAGLAYFLAPLEANRYHLLIFFVVNISFEPG